MEFQVADGSWQCEPLSSCYGTRFEEALTARPFRFEKGLRSFAGWWYFATTGAHIGFESWLERDHLMLMDFDPAVRAVASQPFWLRWRDGRGPAALPVLFHLMWRRQLAADLTAPLDTSAVVHAGGTP